MSKSCEIEESWDLRATQILYLQRNWEILEVFKGLRFKVPVVISGAILALTSFVMKTGVQSGSAIQGWVFPSIIAVLGILGICVLYWIKVQYAYTSGKIKHLYKVIGMDMDSADFLDQGVKAKELHKRREDAVRMFYAGFGGIVFVSGITIAGLILQ